MRHSWVRLVSVALLVVFSETARADVVTLTPVKDNTLFQDAGGLLSNGAGQYIFAGRSDQAASQSRRRAVLKFDIAAALPADAVITDVTLNMNMSRTVSGAMPVSLHRVLVDWGEGTSNAPGQEGGGTASTTGDATWLHSFFNTTFWTNPGGDFDPVVSATTSVVGLGHYTWGSTPEAVADVEFWLANPGSNFGWIVLGEESITGTAKRFDSRESPQTANRPVLQITYTRNVPAASTWGLVVMSVLIVISGTLFLRRRKSVA